MSAYSSFSVTSTTDSITTTTVVNTTPTTDDATTTTVNVPQPSSSPNPQMMANDETGNETGNDTDTIVTWWA